MNGLRQRREDPEFKKKKQKEWDKGGGGGRIENGEIKSENISKGEVIQIFPIAEIQVSEER